MNNFTEAAALVASMVTNITSNIAKKTPTGGIFYAKILADHSHKARGQI